VYKGSEACVITDNINCVWTREDIENVPLKKEIEKVYEI
jgi:hypothetical protein